MSRTSVVITYVLCLWHDFARYQLADNAITSNTVRLMTVSPIVGLIVLNLMAIVRITRNVSKDKGFLKLVLHLNALSEVVNAGFTAYMLLFGASAWIPKETYLGRLLANVFMYTLCIQTAKARWIVLVPPPAQAQAPPQAQAQPPPHAQPQHFQQHSQPPPSFYGTGGEYPAPQFPLSDSGERDIF